MRYLDNLMRGFPIMKDSKFQYMFHEQFGSDANAHVVTYYRHSFEQGDIAMVDIPDTYRVYAIGSKLEKN